jgi:hypothetical protein
LQAITESQNISLNSWHQALSDLSVFINTEWGRKIVNMIIYNEKKWWHRWWNVSVTLGKQSESSPLKNSNFLCLKERIITLNVLIKITEANGLNIGGDELYNE